MGKLKDETLHIKISGDLKDRLTREAEYRDISAAQLVREAIQEKVDASVNGHAHVGEATRESPELV